MSEDWYTPFTRLHGAIPPNDLERSERPRPSDYVASAKVWEQSPGYRVLHEISESNRMDL